MQTFLPHKSFKESARALDYRRLGKQRVETWQIIQAMNGKTKGWVNHPATVMWRKYEFALTVYGIVICKEWIARGYKDSMLERFELHLEQLKQRKLFFEFPAWLGGQIHKTHQSNLLRKNPEYYKELFPDVPDNLDYYWPS